ncbi:MAG: hypothetical protein JWQ83_2244 [Lacunisphaera sp.]|nr:hypothetical protein [Lacunisphaera sp.]
MGAEPTWGGGGELTWTLAERSLVAHPASRSRLRQTPKRREVAKDGVGRGIDVLRAPYATRPIRESWVISPFEAAILLGNRLVAATPAPAGRKPQFLLPFSGEDSTFRRPYPPKPRRRKVVTERWQSGRSRLTRNQVGRKVPGVRIPPSPPFFLPRAERKLPSHLSAIAPGEGGSLGEGALCPATRATNPAYGADELVPVVPLTRPHLGKTSRTAFRRTGFVVIHPRYPAVHDDRIEGKHDERS